MNPIQLTPGDALLVIDMQLDFLPGGKLGVRCEMRSPHTRG